MRRRGPIFAAAVVVVANAVALSGVAHNRAGAPEAELLLTERELPLALWSDESTGVFLRLEWQRSFPRGKLDWPWFDRAKLESLGFDCSRWEREVREGYGRIVPRRAYVVLEYDGPAWARWLEASVPGREEAPPGSAPSISASRLVPIDAGQDPGELRRRYPEPSRHLIVPAVVGAGPTEDAPSGKVVLGGRIQFILVSEIHVPKHLGASLAALRAEDAAAATAAGLGPRGGPVPPRRHTPPRYEVLVRYGVRHEPWVAAVRPLR
jgi:hypothetical protein